MRIRDTVHPSTQNSPPRDNHKHENKDLDRPQNVHDPHSPMRHENVDHRDEANHRNRNASLRPIGNGMVRRDQDVGRKDDASRRGEAQQDGLGREDDRRQEPRPGVRRLEIDLLPARARKHASKLEPHAEPRKREREPEQPQHQRRADAPHAARDRRRSGEDPHADDAADDQERRREQAEMAAQSAGGVFLEREFAGLQDFRRRADNDGCCFFLRRRR